MLLNSFYFTCESWSSDSTRTFSFSVQCLWYWFDSTLSISKLSYAASSWSRFLTQHQIAKLQSIMNKAVRWGFTSEQSVVSLFMNSDTRLFVNILMNENHVLHYLLPPVKETPYHLRASTSHGRLLPRKDNLMEKNFLTRMLYKDVAL